MPAENTPLTFGTNKGRPLRQCGDDYLRWMVSNLHDSDFAEWAVVAKKVLSDRANAGEKVAGDLEAQADAFLRMHGAGNLVDHSKPGRSGYGRPIRRF